MRKKSVLVVFTLIWNFVHFCFGITILGVKSHVNMNLRRVKYFTMQVLHGVQVGVQKYHMMIHNFFHVGFTVLQVTEQHSQANFTILKM